MSRGGNTHFNDFSVDRKFTRVDIYSDRRNNNPASTTDGALVVHHGDAAFNCDIRVRKTAYANKFEGEIAQIFTEFQLINGTQQEAYVLTGDAMGVGNWKTPHWFTNDVPVAFHTPTDNNIWTEHNVGLGITSPNEKFHVFTTTAGEGAQIGRLTLGNWSANSNYALLTNSSLKGNASGYGVKLLNTGHSHFNGRDELQLRINDVMAVTVNSNRYVGIGTDSPQEQLHITENAIIEGNLDVLGNTTTINTETLTIEDNMIKLANNNIGNSTDFGFYGLYIDNGVSKFSGLYRDASEPDNIYKLFDNLSTEPTGLSVTNSDLGFLKLGGLETDLGVTFSPGGKIFHDGLVISGGTEPNYTDHIFFTNNGRIGVGITLPNVDLEVAGDMNTEGNLGIGISMPNPNYSIDTDRTDAYRIPSGTVAQRPVPPIQGLMRFNTEEQIFEGYYETGWGTVGIVIDSDFDTFIDPELFTDDDHMRFFTEGIEAMTIRDGSTPNAMVTAGVNNRNVGIGVSQPYVKLQIEGTDAIKIPIGTTAQRPITLDDGMIRYNTSLQLYEGYSTKYNQWEALQNVRDGDRDTYITAEETADEDCIKMYSNGELRMVIKGDHSGDNTEPLIGIGVTSADPIFPLEIRSTSAALLPNGDNGERPVNAEFGLIRYNNQRKHFEGYGETFLGFKRWSKLQDPIVDNDGDTHIEVEALNDEDKIRFTTDGEQRVIIDSNGYVGIGISVPRKELDVIGDMCLSGTIDIGGDAVITGDLIVHGDTFQANTEIVLIEDPLLKLASNNPSDILDIGFYGLYDGLGVTKFTGLVRDATTKEYTLFNDLGTDPSANTVNFADVGITRAQLNVNVVDTNFIDMPDNELIIRATADSEKFYFTNEAFMGINVYPQYPLHITTVNDQSWSARIKNDIGTDLFLANTEGQGMMMNTNVTSGNGNYAMQIRNTTFGSTMPLLQVMNNGRIGVHTSAPENLLHISTTTVAQGINVGDETKANAYGYFGMYDGSATYTSIGNLGGSLTHTTDYALRQGTSGDTIINAATGQNIEFRHNNDATVANTVYIDTNGNVGIGSNTPAAELDIVGDVQILESTAAYAVRIDNDTTSIDIAHNDGSGILVDSATSFAYKATNGATNNFIVTNAGSVGINTDSPSEKLDIITTALGEGAKIGYTQIGNHISQANKAVFSHSAIYDEADSYALRQDSLGKTELNAKLGQDICFKIDDDQRMVLDQDGRLGLGITTPTNRLDVLGNTRLDGDVVVTGTLSFEGPFVESLTFQDNLLKLAGDNTTDTLDIGFYGCYVEMGDTKYAGSFYDASDNVWRMFDDLEVEPGVTIDVNGTGYTPSKLVIGDAYIINNLGVGIDNPSFKVDIDGTVRADDYITTSDERTKNVLGFLSEEESYNKIKNTDVFRYKLKKDETERERTGFIAQQLERSMPEAIITMRKKIEEEEVEDFKGIDQYAVIANLTNALKHAINKIEKLEEEVLSLKIKDRLRDL